METVFGVCGLECSNCPAFIACKNNDQELRVKTAKQWSEWYKSDITPDDINCIGCMGKGEPKVKHCSECEVRTCAIDKGVSICADCENYSCELLDGFMKYLPHEAKANLKRFRNS